MLTVAFLAVIAVPAHALTVPARPTPYRTGSPLQPRQTPQVQQDAVVPTSSGQIGINPVSISIGDPQQYRLSSLGPETPYMTLVGSTYHYIEDHTDYLFLSTITATEDGTQKLQTSTIEVAVETATASANGQNKGDVGLVFPEGIANALGQTASEAISTCGAKRRKTKRAGADIASCLMQHAIDASDSGGPLSDLEQSVDLSNVKSYLSEGAPQVWKDALQVISNQARKRVVLVILAGIISSIRIDQFNGPITSVNMPAAGVGPAGGSTQKCDPEAEVDEHSPSCEKTDCQGTEDRICTVENEKKDCPCVKLFDRTVPDLPDLTLWEAQQYVISAVLKTNPPSAAPSCTTNNGDVGFDGKPRASPATWCVCNSDGKSLVYSTIPSATAPCALSTLPTATISISIFTPSASVKVTSCRTSTITGTGVGSGPYCTCNDDFQYDLMTWTEQDGPTTGCSPTYNPPLTTTAPPTTSTASPLCGTMPQFHGYCQGDITTA